MRTRRVVSTAVILLVLLLTSLGQSAAQGPAPHRGVQPDAPVGMAFTYQGFLSAGGEPITDACDFQFGLWDDPVTGTLVAGPLEELEVAVSQGRFTVQLNFGGVFDGTALWLEIAVMCTGEPAYTTLAPRQELTAAPYASYSQAAPWEGIAEMPAGFADDIDNDALAELFCASGQLAEWDGTAWVCADDDVDDADADPANELEMPASCANGQIPEWDGTAWICADDDDTTYGAGAGLVLTGTVFAANTDYLQRRVADACGAGYAIRQVNADGSVICELIDTTTYSAGTGLVLSGTVFLVAGPYRLPQLCSGGQIAEWDGAAWACAADDDTTYSEGTGLDLVGTMFSLELAYRLPQGCPSGRIAEWNGSTWVCAIDDVDDADADPANELEMPTSCGGGQIAAWNGSAWVCANDGNTTYTPGDGLDLVGTQFNVDVTDILGTGLSESANNIDIAGSYRLPQGCPNGRIAEWNGSSWICAVDDDTTDHGLLNGLLDDDHPQYFHLSQNETVNGRPAFDGGTSGSTSPFTVDSTYVVGNLNADLLDGYHASAFALDPHDHWGESWTGSGTGLTLSGGTVGLSGSGSTYGVRGVSSATAVYGDGGTYGVYADGTTAVYGSGSSTGVYGNASSVGVQGSSGATGVYADGGSYGVYADGITAVYGSGSTYGVRGVSSATAVYGDGGTYGVYADGITAVYGSGSNYGVYASSSNTGVYGSGSSTGVYGGGSYGLYGSGSSTAVRADGGSYGVYADGTTAIYGSGSGTAVQASGGTYGVYADGSTAVYGSGSNYGVYASASSTGVYGSGGYYGLYGSASDTTASGVSGSGSGTGTYAGVYGYNSNSNTVNRSAAVLGFHGASGTATAFGVVGWQYWDGVGVGAWSYGGNLIEAYSGDYPGGTRRFYITNGGNVYADGTYNTFVPPPAAPEGNTKYYALSAIQSPEAWFEDLGTADLAAGEAVVEIEPTFAGTVNLAEEDYYVFLTPLGDCELYLAERTPTAFTVRAIGGQGCSISFQYRIVAKRLGHEDSRLDVVDIPVGEEVEKEVAP